MRKVCLHPTPLKPSAASVSLSYHLLLHVLLPEGHFSQPYEQQLLRSEMEREREKKGSKIQNDLIGISFLRLQLCVSKLKEILSKY